MHSISSWKHKFDRGLEKVLHLLESIIAAFAMLVLIYVLCAQIYEIVQHPAHLLEEDGVGHFLHQMLTVVVGFEFVKLLMHVTPDNILEVMIMAVARHFVVGSGTAVDSLLNVIAVMLCVAGIIFVRIAHYRDRIAHEREAEEKEEKARRKAAEEAEKANVQ